MIFWKVIVFLIGLSSSSAVQLSLQSKHAATVTNLATSVNVRTVIFNEEDVRRPCFDLETLQLIVARRVMQDLIPKRVARDFPALLEYIGKAEIILKMKTRDEKEYLYMKRAMYDSLGGYLYAFTVPIMNEAYYAGKVSYDVANELHNVLRRMMTFLQTNGGYWADPCDMDFIPTRVHALTLNLCIQDQSCDSFVIASDLQPHLELGIGTATGNQTNCIPEQPKIQLPFLDDNSYPHAIVVPFREHALFSLMTSCSVNIVPKYYVLAMRCLSHPEFTNEDIVFFNQRLHRWIMGIVLPHLQDTDRFFPGFGGIMRVVETMNQRGLISTAKFKHNMKPLNGTFSRFNAIDLDEKWYSSYVTAITSTRGLTIGGILLLFLILLLIILHLFRKAYCRDDDGECTCHDCTGTSDVKSGGRSTVVSVSEITLDNLKTPSRHNVKHSK